MRVDFVRRSNGPERLVVEAEIILDGPLDGMKLTGLSVWKGPDGSLYVTFPSRAFGLGAERRFYDYLRSLDGDPKTIKRVKAWVLAEYERALEGGQIIDPGADYSRPSSAVSVY